MKKILAHALVTMLGAVVLASCAIVNSLVPPLENPLGLDGEEVVLRNDAAGGTGSLLTQQVSSSFTGTTDEGWVSDLDDPPAEPKSLSTELGFAQIVLSGSAALVSEADFPSALTVQRISIDAEIGDGTSSALLVFGDGGLSVDFERSAACTTDSRVRCVYSPSATTVEGLDVVIRGAVMRDLFTVLTSGASLNDVVGSLSISVAPSVPAAVDTAVATIQTTDGRVQVF